MCKKKLIIYRKPAAFLFHKYFSGLKSFSFFPGLGSFSFGEGGDEAYSNKLKFVSSNWFLTANITTPAVLFTPNLLIMFLR
jgi:hypothetical protein